MKKIIFLGAIISTGYSGHAQIQKAELVANGLTCSMCSNATFKQLQTISFLDSIDVDIESTKFILHFKPNAPFDLNLIKAKVENAGFSVGSLMLDIKLQPTAAENDPHYTEGDIKYHFIDNKRKRLNEVNRVKLVDNGFVSEKEFKKYGKIISKSSCYSTGRSNAFKQHYYLEIIE